MVWCHRILYTLFTQLQRLSIESDIRLTKNIAYFTVMSRYGVPIANVTHDSLTGSWCVYWFLHKKHPTTKRKHSSIKSHSQHISIHLISYVWSNFTNRNGGYKLVDNLEATMIAICYQKHRIAFMEASFWNQTFIQLNRQTRFSRSIFIPHIRWHNCHYNPRW